MAIEVFDVPQNSPEWWAVKRGVPSASDFATVMAKGRDGGSSVTRKTLLYKLAGEILTDDPRDSYSNAHMDRGHQLEDEARELYSFGTDLPVIRVGFIRNGRKGCSPDALVGNDGGLEIKTALDHILIEKIVRGTLPAEHVAQVQGNLWISERAWWDLIVFAKPSLPLFQKRAYADEVYHHKLAKAVDLFNEELDEIVAKIRAYDDPDRQSGLRDAFTRSVEEEMA